MKFSEYIQYDGIGLADLIRRKEITPHELLETTIRTIEELNPSLNAVVNKMYDHARRYVDKGLPEAPFSGVPFLLKDLLADYAGIPTSAAWKHHNNVIPDRDAEIVVRQKNAGLIIVGKTALPELAATWNTESELFGNTYNPWNKKYGSGTSSGGSAAAVAAGMVPMAHGGDGGGSIRCPASCCGVVGLKPSRGRNPVGPADGDRWYGMVVEHVLTRSVRDTASMLDVTSGPEIGSFINPAPKDRIFLEDVGVNPGKLRIAFSTKAPYGAQTHPDCIAAVEKTAKLCIELGHEVEEDSPLLPDNGFEALCNVLMPEFAADVTYDEERLGRKLGPDDFEGLIWEFITRGRSISGADHALGLRTLHIIARTYAEFFQKYDIIMTPTLATPPPPIGIFNLHDTDLDGHFERYLEFMPYTHVFNVSGQPAISLPLHWNDEELPIGVQFATRWPEEGTLIRLASQLEEAAPWRDRYPASGS